MSKTLTLAITGRLARVHRNAKTQTHNLADAERANGLIWAVCDANRMLVIIVLGASKWQISHTHKLIHTHTHNNGWSVGHFEIKAFITSDCPFIRRKQKMTSLSSHSAVRRCSCLSVDLNPWSCLLLWSNDVCAGEAGESKGAASQCELRTLEKVGGCFCPMQKQTLTMAGGRNGPLWWLWLDCEAV